MPSKKFSCPQKGTIEVVINQNPNVHLAHVLLEGGEHKKFAKTLKDLFHPKGPISTATSKILSHREELEYLNELIPDIFQVVGILRNASKNNKLLTWSKSKQKTNFLLLMLTRFNTISNSLESFTKNQLKHCKEK